MIKMSSQRCSTISQKRDIEKIYIIKEKGRSLKVKETMWRYYNNPQVNREEGHPHRLRVPKQSKPDQSQSKSDDSKLGSNKPRRSARLEAKRNKDAALH
jgi:hypothetical protein